MDGTEAAHALSALAARPRLQGVPAPPGAPDYKAYTAGMAAYQQLLQQLLQEARDTSMQMQIPSEAEAFLHAVRNGSAAAHHDRALRLRYRIPPAWTPRGSANGSSTPALSARGGGSFTGGVGGCRYGQYACPAGARMKQGQIYSSDIDSCTGSPDYVPQLHNFGSCCDGHVSSW